jgi:hypothetical protein
VLACKIILRPLFNACRAYTFITLISKTAILVQVIL